VLLTFYRSLFGVFMDFLTQVLLGCAIGELLLGRKYGRSAIVLGGIAGALPDADVLLNIFLNDLNDFIYHRVFTHSFVFAIFGGLLATYVTKKFKYFKKYSFKEIYLVFFTGIVTHFLLDLLTTYGTAIFYPFTRTTYALNSIFIVDLFYTISLLFFFVLGVKVKDKNKRFKFVLIGFIISCLYLFSGLLFHSIVESSVEQDFIEKGIYIDSFMVQPTVSNIINWRMIGQDEDYIYEGYKSIFALGDEIKIDKYAKNHELREEIRSVPRIDELIVFSHGYYILAKDGDKLIYVDIRFGSIEHANVFLFELRDDEIVMYR